MCAFRWLLLAPMVLAVAAGACGSPAPPPSSCPDDFHCPSPAPTFAADANPVLQDHCVTCHNPTGMEPTRLLDTYDHVYSLASTVIMQLRRCVMPPTGQTPLTEPERQALLGWLACGAMNDDGAVSDAAMSDAATNE